MMNRLGTSTLTVVTLLVPTLLPVPMLAQAPENVGTGTAAIEPADRIQDCSSGRLDAKASLDRFTQQRLVLTGDAAPLAEAAKTIRLVTKSVLIDHGRHCAGIIQAIGRGHGDAELGQQPAGIIDEVMKGYPWDGSE
jgi:hypothetical protein